MNSFTWEDINYNVQIPDSFIVPPHHWPELEFNSLSDIKKIKFNHFLTYFMCEMLFILKALL